MRNAEDIKVDIQQLEMAVGRIKNQARTEGRDLLPEHPLWTRAHADV